MRFHLARIPGRILRALRRLLEDPDPDQRLQRLQETEATLGFLLPDWKPDPAPAARP